MRLRTQPRIMGTTQYQPERPAGATHKPQPNAWRNRRVNCPECGKEGAQGNLRTHLATVHKDKP